MSQHANYGRWQVRWLFISAAIWNIAVAITALAAPATMSALVYREALPLENRTALFAWDDFAACVLLFGIGYAIVARDPARNPGLVVVGIAGKLGVVIAWGYRWMLGDARWFGLLPVAIDGLFAIAFVGFLLTIRGRKSVDESSYR